MEYAELYLKCVRLAWDYGHAFHHGDVMKSLELANMLYELALEKQAEADKAARPATAKKPAKK